MNDYTQTPRRELLTQHGHGQPFTNQMANWLGRQVGSVVNNPTVRKGMSAAFSNPWTGALATAVPGALLGWGGASIFNRLIQPRYGGGQLPQIEGSRAAMLGALLAAGAGGYLGHARKTNFHKASSFFSPQFMPQPALPTMAVPALGMLPPPSWPMMVPMPAGAGMMPMQMPQQSGRMDALQEIASVIQQSHLPLPTRVQALEALPMLPSQPANMLAKLVGGIGGGLAGAMVVKVLNDFGLLAPAAGAVAGGMLGSSLMSKLINQ